MDNNKPKGEDSVFNNALSQSSTELWKSTLDDGKADAIAKRAADAVIEQESYHSALKQEVDAESNWRRAVPDASSLSADQIKKRLENPDLGAYNRGFLSYLQDNFSQIAGIAGRKDKQDTAKISIADVGAVGAMNEISPEKIEHSVKFLQEKFFELSGMDNKVTKDRIEKLFWDHSFKLFPKETQDRITDLINVMKSVDQRPENFQQGKKAKAGLSIDDAEKLNAVDLSDNLRVQALQKWMFGKNVQKFDSNTLGKDALAQYNEAAQRYKQLKDKGMDAFLQK